MIIHVTGLNLKLVAQICLIEILSSLWLFQVNPGGETKHGGARGGAGVARRQLGAHEFAR